MQRPYSFASTLEKKKQHKNQEVRQAVGVQHEDIGVHAEYKHYICVSVGGGGLNAWVQRKRPFFTRPQQFLDAADNLWLFFQKWDFSSHLASRSSQSQAHFHTGKVSYYFELLNPAHGYRYCMCSWRESTHTLMHKLCMKIEKRGRRINRAVGKNKIFSTYFSFIGGTIGHSSPLFPHLKIKPLEMTQKEGFLGCSKPVFIWLVFWINFFEWIWRLPQTTLQLPSPGQREPKNGLRCHFPGAGHWATPHLCAAGAMPGDPGP